MFIILHQSVLGSLALILYHIFYGLLCLPLPRGLVPQHKMGNKFPQIFWPHLNSGFLVVFRIWRVTPISPFMPIMSTSILVKTIYQNVYMCCALDD